MECEKIGSNADGFKKKGQAWFCTTGLRSDVTIEVGNMIFHLHKFPLISRSGKLATMIGDSTEDDNNVCTIHLPEIPGGENAFELAAKFCYGVKIELIASNMVALRCAAEYLEMTEEFGEGNLIAKTENFFNHVVLCSWKDSVQALESCAPLMPHAEQFQIVKKCVDSIAIKACTDPSLFGWPILDHRGSMQSPGGSVLWNGINTGARPKVSRSNWWYEDVSALNFPLFEKLISTMVVKGLRAEIIAGALVYYAKKILPGLNRRHDGAESGNLKAIMSTSSAPESEQRVMLESIETLLPLQKGVTPTRFLFGLLRLAIILNASLDCKDSLERRIGVQLEQATLDDLLLPNYLYTVETLYDIDTVHRILDHFLIMDQRPGPSSSSIQSFEEGPLIGSPSLSPIMMVAKLMDEYLSEVAPDGNLKPSKFQSLAESLPDYSRLLDDGLYRAIDIYLKAHPWLSESERERLCRIMNCQKLSLEACTHAAQNERLPLRVVVQVLFFEQLQLRTAIAGCFLVADNVGNAKPIHSSNLVNEVAQGPHSALRGDGWGHVVRENQVLKGDMDRMMSRVNELEKECTTMRGEIEKFGKGKGSFSSLGKISTKFGCKMKPQISNSR